MDEHALRVLEFDRVRDRVARLTAFAGGHELALALTPASGYDEVVRRQRLLAEAVSLRGSRAVLGLNGAADIRAATEKAALGGVIDAIDLKAIAETQRVAEELRSVLERAAPSLPLLGLLGERLTALPGLVAEISRSIDARGEVADAASPALAIVRRDIRTAHDRLHSRLQEFLGSASTRLAVQEPIVTLRDGRYVIPIKADFRGEVRGIVHDVSASGATLFIEPLVVVDLANQWRELQIEERHEVERVLRALSALAGKDAPALTANFNVLAEIDLVMAAARLHEELAGQQHDCLPQPGGDPTAWLTTETNGIVLNEARHPLLTTPVPISLDLAASDRVMLITGPNTGGKTVALKTIGLLSLMAQAGLPVAAEAGTRLPVFTEVLADIGDEQSIEQSLSTFSGHMRNLISILNRAGNRSLVLLDELAAGTDPAEGSALAKAVLQHLLAQGALTIATTHHGELKLFAHSTPGVRNAAVEFNPETLAPTYRLTIGLPGRSNALAIAARLGLDPSIIETARASLAPEQLEIDSLLEDIRTEREEAQRARADQEQSARRAEEARSRAEQRLAEIEEGEAERLEEAAFALEAEIDATRSALAEIQRTARERPMPLPAELAEAKETIATAAETTRRLRRRSRRKRPDRPEQTPIFAGARLWLRGVPTPAEALGSPNSRGEVDVALGALRARIRTDQIVRVDAPVVTPLGVTVSMAPQVGPVAEQIEVRGQTLDEALPKVEALLDAAYRAGIPRLRVIHGKGTGKMRLAVRALLAKHPFVKGFEFAEPRDGGEGVTVVEMTYS